MMQALARAPDRAVGREGPSGPGDLRGSPRKGERRGNGRLSTPHKRLCGASAESESVKTQEQLALILAGTRVWAPSQNHYVQQE